MKTSRIIKIFLINTVFIILAAKIIPLFSTEISERIVERILLIYFLIFNVVLLIILNKDKKAGA